MSCDGTLGRSIDDPTSPRIGVRVRALVDDGFITPGMTGQVTNRLPTAAAVRVIWDNDTASVVKLEVLELVGDRPRRA